MRVLFYRDCRALNRIQIAKATVEGTAVSDAYTVRALVFGRISVAVFHVGVVVLGLASSFVLFASGVEPTQRLGARFGHKLVRAPEFSDTSL